MFYYFGAKHRTAHKYQAPQHRTIVEPFAGSAAYACYWMAKGEADRAVLVEKDERVVELWHRLLSSTPDQVRNWPVPAIGERTDDLMVTLHGGGAALRSLNDQVVTERMYVNYPPMLRRMASWVAAFGDRIEIIEGDYRQAPHIEATWFVDPPYQYQGHQYAKGSDGIDYDELAAYCRTRNGQVIVCEQEPAEWLPFRPYYTQQSTADTMSVELVWESDPMPTLFD